MMKTLTILILHLSVGFSLPAFGDLSNGKLKDSENTTEETRFQSEFRWLGVSQDNEAHLSLDMHAVTEGFIFPNEEKNVNNSQSLVFLPSSSDRSPPECAKGSTFCEHVDNYPEEYLDSKLESVGDDIKAMFGSDLPRQIQQKIIDNTEASPLCISQEIIIYPRTAKNKDSDWLFIVNKEPYTQGVRIGKCIHRNDSKSCAFTEGFPIGYKAYCEQSYVYRTMIALDKEGKTVSDVFQLPSCCSCVVKAPGQMSRFNENEQQNRP